MKISKVRSVVKSISVILILSMVITALPSNAINILPIETQTVAISKDVKIIGEIEDKRDRFTKTFMRDDNSQLVIVSSQALHYKENDKWENIDNTLLSGTDSTGESVYQNNKSSLKVKLPKTIKAGKSIEVEKDSYKLSFTMVNDIKDSVSKVSEISTSDSANKSEAATFTQFENKSSNLKYSNILANTDLKYSVEPEALKEEIIINKKPTAQIAYNYEITTDKLTGSLLADNSIEFYNNAEKTGEPVFVLPTPFMYDKDGAVSYDITVAFSEVRKGVYSLIYTPSHSWMIDSLRTYPVVIDPVIQTTKSTTNVDDAQVSSIFLTTNYGTLSSIGSGYHGAYGSTRSYLKFNSLPSIYSGDVVTSAKIYLNQITTGSSSELDVYKATSSWIESGAGSVTWNTAVTTATTITDFAIPPTTIDPNNAWQSWDITSMTRDWYLTPSTNYGVLFKSNPESTFETYRSFSSSESTDTTKIPYMEITYTNSIGLEGYWDYHSQNAGQAGTAYVNDYTGNLVVVRDDIGVSGNKMPVDIQMIYNSNNRMAYPFYGYGWNVNYRQTVSKMFAGTANERYLFVDADGTNHYFCSKDANNVWSDEDGLGFSLTEMATVGADNAKYAIQDTGTILQFSASGYLIRIKDKSNPLNAINIAYRTDSYSYLINKITDGAGRVYQFNYQGSMPMKLSNIQYKLSEGSAVYKSVSYNYDINYNLTKVDLPNGESVQYTYATDHLISSINDASNTTDLNATKIKYEYTTYTLWSPPRVNLVSLFGNDSTITTDGTEGGHLHIVYANNNTTFTDNRGRKEIKQFNNSGNTMSVRDEKDNAVFGRYSEASGSSKNKLLEMSKLQNSTVNIINNYSFENTNPGSWSEISAGGAIAIVNKFNTAEKYMGNQSCSINMTNNLGQYALSWYQQGINNTYKTYTFSAWVKTAGFSNADKGAWISIKYWNPSLSGEVSSQAIKTNGDWTKLEVSFSVPQSAYTSLDLYYKLNIGNNGTAYFDCVQAAECKTGTGTNLIDNADFSDSTYAWATENTNTSDLITNLGIWSNRFSGLVYKMTGEPNKIKRIYQTVAINGNKGDNFVAAAWAKGLAVPIDNTLPDVYSSANAPASTAKDFSLRVRVVKSSSDTSSTPEKTYRFPFNDDSKDWQYIAGSITAEYAYSSVEVSLVYTNQANYAYFDGIQLCKENFGNKYSYDASGNLTTITDQIGSTSTIEYNAANLPVAMLDGEGNRSSVTYDDFNRIIKAFSNEAVGSAFTYDDFGNMETQSTTDGRVSMVTTNTYSESAAFSETNGNYLETTTDPMGNTIELDYDMESGKLNTITDAKDKTTNYTLDASQRLLGVRKDVTGIEGETYVENNYAYDTKELLDTISHNNFTYDFDYDTMGALTNVKVGTQTILSNSYNTTDKSWNLNTTTYGNGNTIGYLYDDRDNVKSIKLNGVDKFLFNYDNTYSLIGKTDIVNELETKYVFDGAGRTTLTTETGSGTKAGYVHSIGSVFDSLGRGSSLLETIQQGAGSKAYTTSYIQDKDGRNNGAWFEWGSLINNEPTYKGSKEIRYDSLGRVASNSITLLDRSATTPATNPLFWTYYHYTDKADYKTTPQVYSMNMVLGAGQDKFDWTNYFTYDANNNITGIDDIRVSSTTRSLTSTTYSYDEINQLVRYNDQKANRTWTYQYDKGGNIRNKKEYTYTIQADLSGLTPIKTYDYSYSDTNWKDKLMSYDGKAITYDLIGNLETYDGWTYIWEAGRQLATMNKTGNALSFKYNENGVRTSKTYNGTTTLYTLIGDKVTYETNGTDSIYYRYDVEDSLISFSLNGTEYFYIRNLQGDITGLLDKDGTVVTEYSYDAWGKLLTTTGTLASTVGVKNPYLYRGYRYDSETGLYYLQSRYYNPETCRMLNADDTSILLMTQGDLLGANLFAYCGNNPVMNSDPSGYIYISYGQLASVFQRISDISRAFRLGTSQGIWGLLAGYAAPYIALCFAWVNTLPVVGQFIFGVIVFSALWFATQTITAYFIKKTGLDITLGRTWFAYYPVVKFR